MSKLSVPEDGWFVAVDERQHGPLSASQAWHLATGIETPCTIRVWHPSLPGWRLLPTPADPSPPPAAGQPSPQKLNLSDIRLSNARYLVWIACGAAPVFVLGAALARALPDSPVSTIVVALVAYMGWWLYLEHAGLRLHGAEIVFPRRIAIWPFPALWLRRVRIADVTGFECWSRGAQVFWFRLNTSGRPTQILLDDALHREILVLALEQRLPLRQETSH